MVVPDAVDGERVNAARRAINKRINELLCGAQTVGDLDPHAKVPPGHNTATIAAFKALFSAPRLRSALESLIGPLKSDYGPGQVAVNFPDGGAKQLDGWHIDASESGKLLNSFSVLLLVALSDQTRDVGNFQAALGSHVEIARATKEYHEKSGAVRNETDTNFRQWLTTHGNVPRYEPKPIMLKPGDVAIVHSKTAHRRGFNATSDVRYMAIFRLHAQGHRSHSSTQICEAFPPGIFPGLVGLVD